MKRNQDIIGSVNIVTVPEQYRIQTSQIFLYVQGVELNGKIAKYRYRMKKMKVFGGYKLNKHWAAAVQQGAEWFESMSLQVRLLQAHGAKPGIKNIWRL